MANSNQNSDNNPPENLANVTPNVSSESGQTRLIIKALEDALTEIKSDVRDIKANRHSDFVYMISVFALGFLLLAGMLIAGYFRLDDSVGEVKDNSIKTGTKLEDLLLRIPPVQTSPPRR